MKLKGEGNKDQVLAFLSLLSPWRTQCARTDLNKRFLPKPIGPPKEVKITMN